GAGPRRDRGRQVAPHVAVGAGGVAVGGVADAHADAPHGAEPELVVRLRADEDEPRALAAHHDRAATNGPGTREAGPAPGRIRAARHRAVPDGRRVVPEGPRAVAEGRRALPGRS